MSLTQVIGSGGGPGSSGAGLEWFDNGVFLRPSGGASRQVVIGATAPIGSEILRVVGDVQLDGLISLNGSISATGGSYSFFQISAPTAPTSALKSPAAAGNVDNGAHSYLLVYKTNNGKFTSTSTSSNTTTIVNKTINGQILVSTIPVSSNNDVTNVEIYRDNNGDGTYKFVAEVSNGTTSYLDNIANASLGSVVSIINTTGNLYVEGQIGIGTTTPYGNLDIHGAALVESATSWSASNFTNPFSVSFFGGDFPNSYLIFLPSDNGGVRMLSATGDGNTTPFDFTALGGAASLTVGIPIFRFENVGYTLVDNNITAQFDGNGTQTKIFANGGLSLSQADTTIAAPTVFSIGTASHTGLTAGTSWPHFSVGAQTKTFAAGAIASNSDIVFSGSTHLIAGAGGNIAIDTTVALTAPILSTGATATDIAALYFFSANVGAATNSYAAVFNANTGATNNYSAKFANGPLDITGSALWTHSASTVTAASTTTLGSDGQFKTVSGNTTINYITTSNWPIGTSFDIYFSGTPTLTHLAGAVPAGTLALRLSGSGNYAIAAGAAMRFVNNGANIQEISRTAF